MKLTISVPREEYARLKETGYLQKTTVEQVVLQKILSPRPAPASRKRLSPADKAKQGMFMSLRELAVITGFGHHHMCAIAKKPEFPLFEGRVRYSEFLKWYQAQVLPGIKSLSMRGGNSSLPVSDDTDIPLRSLGSRKAAPNEPRGHLPFAVGAQRRAENS
jgi:hypothetical protein